MMQMNTSNGKRCLFAIVLSLILVVSSSCSVKKETDPAVDIKRNVVLIVKMKDSDYWRTVRMGAEAAGKEFNVALSVLEPDDEEDVQGQISLANQAMREGAGALVLASNDYKALAVVTESAADQRIPVITVDSQVNSSKVRSFIGINNYDAGKQAGHKLIQLTGEKARIAVLSNGKDSRNSELREQGLLDAVSKYPDVQVLEKEYCQSDKKLCGEQTKKMIERHTGIDGIIALNAVSSIAVADEVQKLGLAGKVKVITFDSTPEDIEFLQEGVIQATMIQNPFSMGYLGVKYAVEAMDGHKIPEFVDTGTRLIDQENMFWLDNQKLLFPFVK